MNSRLLILLFLLLTTSISSAEGLPLFWWQTGTSLVNFGDYMSLVVTKRMVENNLGEVGPDPFVSHKKLLASGSVIHFASDGDVVWGSGVNGKHLDPADYDFETLDIRAVRGPLTRKFLMDNFNVEVPAVYGDPALLFAQLYPEFKKSEHPNLEYLIIPHMGDSHLFPKFLYKNVVFPIEPWNKIVEMICRAKLVISSSLHGIILAESLGVPARMLRVSNGEPLFKFADYYYGTGRYYFSFATSIEEALEIGGERPHNCDLNKLFNTFPFEYWYD